MFFARLPANSAGFHAKKLAGATTCTPIANAAVDIWHCDAGGIYQRAGAAAAIPAIASNGSGYVAMITLGVKQA